MCVLTDINESEQCSQGCCIIQGMLLFADPVHSRRLLCDVDDTVCQPKSYRVPRMSKMFPACPMSQCLMALPILHIARLHLLHLLLPLPFLVLLRLQTETLVYAMEVAVYHRCSTNYVSSCPYTMCCVISFYISLICMYNSWSVLKLQSIRHLM